VVASSDRSDFTAFLALLSRMEIGRARVEGADGSFEELGAGEGGGDGFSVLHASQQRKVGWLTRVQISQVHELLMGRGDGAGVR